MKHLNPHTARARSFIWAIIFLTLTACQQTATPRAQPVLPTLIPTQAATVTVPHTPTTRPSATASRTSTASATPSATITVTRAVTSTPTPMITTPSPLPTATRPRPPLNLPAQFIFGYSAGERALIAYTVGQGDTPLLLVGGIHGGFEANTIDLVEGLRDHFLANSGRVLPGLTLIFVPTLNPDGLAAGDGLIGRFNGNGVDLNRNWDCGWEPVAYLREREINPGTAAFSEPESTALAALINDIRPAAVLFYHSAAGGVFAGDCAGSGTSDAMSAVLGEATGYPYGSGFSEYTVTGTAPSWVDSIGIPAADVELFTADAPEFTRNLNGVMALQCWLLGDPVLPTCRELMP